MKKILLLLVMICALALTRCGNELNLGPLGTLNNETFYQTEQDFEAASLSAYSAILTLYFSQFGEGWYQSQLFPDDDALPANNADNDQEDFNWNPTNGEFLRLWSHCYNGISRANIVITELTSADGFSDPENKKRYEAEAKFIRAYLYFILTTNFGGVPGVVEPISTIEGAQAARAEQSEIWNLIVADLQYAQANLPAEYGDENAGRATSGAATALLGKTHLYRAQWEGNASFYGAAITEFAKLEGQYELVEDFEDNFGPSTENNAESVFEIQFSEGGGNPWLSTDFNNQASAGTGRQIFWMAACGPNNDCAPGADGLGYGRVHISQALQDEFEPNDPRRMATIYQEGDTYFIDTVAYQATWSITGSTPAKYIRQEGGEEELNGGSRFPNNRSVNNDRIVRYADVLLMLAEAELLGNGNVARAAELINQVRARARNSYEAIVGEAAPTGVLPARPAGASTDQMLEWLQHERRVELALEGHRYQDLVRWHRAGLINIANDIDFGRAIANSQWSEQNLIKPIPQAELDLNPALTQNEEYL